MFAGVRRFFGAIRVTETSTDIQVTGVPADVLARDISKLWNTKRINAWMFTSMGKNSFSFPKFFAIEVHYMLQQLDEYRYSKSSVRVIRHIVAEMEANTWLKQLADDNITSRVDLTRLSGLNFKLFNHQNNFLKAYGEMTQRYNLTGYLAAADPGTGKTIMSLALAWCLKADLTVIVVPKVALNRVWTSTLDKIYKKVPPYWVANSDVPYNREKIILTHYEALPKAIEAARRASHSQAAVILDESHNLNEIKSNRTLQFLELCKVIDAKDVIWCSGTPLKAMGYEVVPLLRSIDPLFTHTVEERFLKIFGKETGRAVDILRNRIGKVSFHISGAEVIGNKSSTEVVNVDLPNKNDYTLDTIREKMRKFIDERIKHYSQNFKQYQAAYDAGIVAYEKVMPEDKAADFKRYQKAIKMISKGYDPKVHKDEAIFANAFEAKQILPSIADKETRDGFKEAKSVIKYVKLKVVGEALGGVVGKARAQCHVDMAPHVDWKAIAEGTEKKVVVFTSFVEAVLACEKAIKKAGYESSLVYGATTSNVAGIVEQFGKNPKIKFLVATYQSLSTAVPLVMADTSVFLNQPFRSFELEQARARTDRIGQDAEVKFVDIFLDTGKEPNISTRAKDILEWSKQQVEAMMGGLDKQGIAAELNKDYNAGAMEMFVEQGTQFTAVFNAWMDSENVGG